MTTRQEFTCTTKSRVLTRYENNPILSPADMPFSCCAIYNSGVIKTNEGQYIMASRFEEPNKRQHTWISRSSDGIKFIPDSEPVKFVSSPEDEEEYIETTTMSGASIGTWYDPRINPVENKYYITYAVMSINGCRIAIGETEDFKTVTHISFPLHVQNRNAVLFPEKIAGKYWMLHRPQKPDGSGNIWMADSPDLKYWGNCKVVARPESFWECCKIGPGAPPVKTEHGWLIIYHGVFSQCNGYNYGLGAMLLDLEKPWKVVSRGKYPILFVEEIYEMIGQVPNVIFPGGIIPEADGTVKVYYGAADYVQCLATGKMSNVIDFCFNKV